MTEIVDTIVALATPPGVGGIGVVRISGPAAATIAASMLGSLPEPRRATYRAFLDARGQPIDSGIALYFPAPASFTGESVIELQGHGGPVVMAQLVDAALTLGARLAAPGEFTRRAFLNDRLDLVQAEAVADLIASSTAQAARAALRSLAGVFSKEVHALVEQLTRLRIHVEAAIDFPEEEIDFLLDADLQASIESCADAFNELRVKTASGRVLRDGYRVVIFGRPNAGKSSLLNYLSGQEAAIVTEIAGTTRDILREQINIDGLAVELVDTAGLRDDPDRIEEEGIRRAREAMSSADALLWIQDATEQEAPPLSADLPDGAAVVVVRNKIDLTDEAPGEARDDPEIIRLSAKTGAGVEALRVRLRDLAGYKNLGEGAVTARKRHTDALQSAAAHFEAGRDALAQHRAGELFAEELRLAQAALGEITGEVTSDDLLGRIFADFCIGK
jgi:tRNA modification GTPase